MEENRARPREMEGSSDGGKNSNSVVKTSEEEEEQNTQYHTIFMFRSFIVLVIQKYSLPTK